MEKINMLKQIMQRPGHADEKRLEAELIADTQAILGMRKAERIIGEIYLKQMTNFIEFWI